MSGDMEGLTVVPDPYSEVLRAVLRIVETEIFNRLCEFRNEMIQSLPYLRDEAIPLTGD